MHKLPASITLVLTQAFTILFSWSCAPAQMDFPSFDTFLESVNRDTRSKIKIFRNECDSSTENETFIFFSDPHLFFPANRDTTDLEHSFNSKFSVMKNICQYLGLNFIICGGDWITKDDYQEFAEQELLFAKHYMNRWFKSYYPIMGNHDTNYMGFVSEDEPTPGYLPKSFIEGSLFKEFGGTSYAFYGERTVFYILDSGIDWKMTDDKKSQLHRLANSLSKSENEHIVIAYHSFYNGSDITSMSQAILKICNAFNNKGCTSFDKVNYDFSSSRGQVHFILAGHNHKDSVDIEQGIPVIRIINFLHTGVPSYDLCLIDYDKMKLYMTRIGDGNSRTIDF